MAIKPINKLLPTSTEILSDARQVNVICSTAGIDRMGDIIVQEGLDLTAYRKNPVVLWGHDSNIPVARAVQIGLEGGKLKAKVQFPAEGEDAESDRIYGKIKAGIVNATSVGFRPQEFEPIDPTEPWGGMKYTKSELLEFSFVSVPANKDCLIVGRSIFAVCDSESAKPDAMPPEQLARIVALPAKFRELAKSLPHKAKGVRGQLLRCANIAEREIRGDGADWRMGAARDLPIDTSDSWDGAAAAASMLDAATNSDGEINADEAKRGFLAFDASNSSLRGSYKLPFAEFQNGKLEAVAGGIRAAASRLPQTDIPQSVKDDARAVLDAYEARMQDKKTAGATPRLDLSRRKLAYMRAGPTF